MYKKIPSRIWGKNVFIEKSGSNMEGVLKDETPIFTLGDGFMCFTLAEELCFQILSPCLTLLPLLLKSTGFQT